MSSKISAYHRRAPVTYTAECTAGFVWYARTKVSHQSIPEPTTLSWAHATTSSYVQPGG